MVMKKILGVEDDPLNMKLVRTLVQREDYHILEAVNAENGIDLTRDHHPDLILMDIQLPGMDGLSAARLIRKERVLVDVPIVALTSHAMDGDREIALAAGCAGYLTKPIDTRNFLKTIGRFLDINDSGALAPSNQPIVHKNKILIVDDEPLNVKLLAAKLPGDRYETLRAYSGREALDKVAQEPPDLILLDIMMPGMGGYEVTRRLKGDPETKDIPIIMVTALDGAEDEAKGLEVGADEFLNKPVNTIELLARINSLVRLKQYRDHLMVRTQSEGPFKMPSTEDKQIKRQEKLPLVLLVEDDERDAKLIQGLLRGEPYQLKRLKDGEEAISAAQQEKVGLILLDILLPGIDGFEVCRRLKDMDTTREIQVIMITSLQDLESKIKGIELGADEYLVKPIDGRELRARVEVLLEKKTYFEELRSHSEATLDSAIKDGLTGLYNRAFFSRFLDLEVKRARRQGYPLALMMLDIENFRQCRETLGPVAAEIVLRELAQVSRKNVREVDLLARYGEKQFVMALPYVDNRYAIKIAERVHQALKTHSFSLGISSPPHITFSMGIVFCPSHAYSPEELIQKSEYAVHRAREEKSRIFVFRISTKKLKPARGRRNG